MTSMIQHVLTIHFDEDALARAFGTSPADARAIMTDARTATPIIQRRLAADHEGWTLTQGPGGSDELRDPSGEQWRVKSITEDTNFPPSKQIGIGRRVDEDEFVANWGGLAGYLLLDIQAFPDVTVYMVPIANIQRWYEAGELGKSAKAKRSKLMRRLLPDTKFAS